MFESSQYNKNYSELNKKKNSARNIIIFLLIQHECQNTHITHSLYTIYISILYIVNHILSPMCRFVYFRLIYLNCLTFKDYKKKKIIRAHHFISLNNTFPS